MQRALYDNTDIGCYQDGSKRSDLDILTFCIDHGYTLSSDLPDDPESEDYAEALDQELEAGIEWLNEHWVTDDVRFVLEAGDLMLVTEEV